MYEYSISRTVHTVREIVILNGARRRNSAAGAVFDSCPYAQTTENDCNSVKSAVFCASLSLRIT